MKMKAIWNWIFAASLAVGTATFALADDHGSGSGKNGSDDPGSSTTVDSGSTSSGQPAADDNGNHAEPGDDKGGQTTTGTGSSPVTGDDHGGGQDLRLRRKLVPTIAGRPLDASGHFVIRMQGSRQRFQVEAEALVPNGTILMVFADNNLAGSLTIQLGEGELQLDSEDGDLPEGLDPVKAIKTVTVTDSNGTVILQGQV